MIDDLSYLINKVSLLHLNILFLLGTALFGGTIGGRLFQKIKIPRVVGYILIGIIIGCSGFKIVNKEAIQALQPFSYFALGLIGFTIGGELKKNVLHLYGKQFIYILFSEAIFAFIIVSLFTAAAGFFLFTDKSMIWPFALIIGTIASATDAASTISVFNEYKSKGPLTITTLGIVALDDALAFLLFAVTASFIAGMTGYAHQGQLQVIGNIAYEIGGSIFIGLISGIILTRIIKNYSEEDRILAFSLGTVLIVLGLSLAIKVDMLIAAMALGTVTANLTPRKSQEVFKLVNRFTPPIYVLFFVLVGATLNLRAVKLQILILALIYIIGRTCGKTIGSRLGTKLSRSLPKVQRYLPLCLLSQASAAIGLAILTSQRFPDEIGTNIVMVITITTFILQMLGPYFVKVACLKAGEAGLDITEEDLILASRAQDVMDNQSPHINEQMPLNKILKIFSENDNLYYPVVNSELNLIGVITIDNIKNTFMETGLNNLLLAHDLMEPVPAVINPNTPLTEVREILKSNDMEYLPVVDEKNKIVGILEERSIKRLISRKILVLQKKAESLG